MPSFSLQLSPLSSRTKFTNTQTLNPSTNPTNTNPLPCFLHSTEHIFLNSVATVRLLNSCAAAENDPKVVSCIHASILKSGLDANVFVSNSLLDVYAKCGQLRDAVKVFDDMPERNVVSWTTMMSGHCRNGDAEEVLSTFRKVLLEDVVPPNEFTLAVLLQACARNQDLRAGEMVHGFLVAKGFVLDCFVQNSLIEMYSKCGSLIDAEKLNRRASCRDVVSWTSIISGCVLHGLVDKALILFSRMQEDAVVPNGVTILNIIQACSSMNEPRILGWIHGLVIKGELCRTVFVVNSLVEMYSRNGFVEEGMKMFSQFCFVGTDRYLEPETMATLIQGCVHSGSLKQGEGIHGYLIKQGFFPCTIVENSLIDMYAKHEQGQKAYHLFMKMKERDIISWNTMIACYAKNGPSCDALRLLTDIHSNLGGSIAPDFVTMLNSLQACSELASLQHGQIIHGYVTRSGFGCDVFIGNSLIDMYAKSGRIDFAEQVFEDMPIKDMGSWNSMIAAYGIHGDGKSALWVLAEMKKSGGGHVPNAITFVNVLSACGRSGMIKEGYECFEIMCRDYRIEPSMEHFACMVDLLGRSGRLKEAEGFINEMPVKPGPAVWGALLGACGLFGNVEIAERVVERLSVLEPESRARRVVMSNIYAGAGRWEDAAKVRAEMKGEGLRKDAGWSSVEVQGESFKFMVGDTRHPEREYIYGVLDGIMVHIRDLF